MSIAAARCIVPAVAVLLATCALHSAYGESEQTRSAAPAKTVRIRVGETRELELAPGNPEKTSIVVVFTAKHAGPVTVDATSYDVDCFTSVTEETKNGAPTRIAEDDNGGIATNSLLGFEAHAGVRYAISVRATSQDWGGVVTVSLRSGAPVPVVEGPEHPLSREYWERAIERATSRNNDLALARALNGEARLLREIGAIAGAKPLCERALAIREKQLGPEHPDVAESLNTLSELLLSMGAYGEAKPLLERALAIQEEHLGPEHPDVATSLHNLAYAHWYAGALADAKPLFERALVIREKRLGPENGAVAASLRGLGLTLMGMNACVEAKPPLERALAIFEKLFGCEDPAVADTMTDLANLLGLVGAYAEAKPLLERALAIREKLEGPEGQDVAYSLVFLGTLLYEMAAYSDAKPLLERALAINEKLSNQFQVATTLHDLAMVLTAMGARAEATLLYERALALWDKQLGPEHEFYLQSLGNQAAVLMNIGAYADAKPLLERVLAIQEKKLGAEHPDVAWALNDLADGLRAMGAYGEARPLLERALEIQEKQRGAEHPSVAWSLNNLALLLEDTGAYAEAKALFERALAIREKRLGPENPDVAASLRGLGRVLTDMNDYVEAKPLLERALAIREKRVREPWNVAESLDDLAVLLARMGAYADAERLFERALAIRGQDLGPEHPEVARQLVHIGAGRLWAGDLSGAHAAAARAEEISRAHFNLTVSALSQNEALLFAGVRASGLPVLLSLATGPQRGDAEIARQAWDELTHSRALVLDELARRRRALKQEASGETAALWTAQGEASARLAWLYHRGRGKEASEQYRARVDDARRALDQAERELAATSVAFRRLKQEQEVGLAEAMRSLPPDAALVAFARYESIVTPPTEASKSTPSPAPAPSYVAFVMRSGDPTPRVYPLGPADAIEKLVKEWREGVAEAREANAPGRQLRKLIWDPLARSLAGAKLVLVVPDGAVHQINFSALPLEDGRFLIEAAPPIHYLGAERDLTLAPDERLGSGLLALGDPAFDATAPFAALRPKETLPILAPAAVGPEEAAALGPRGGARSLRSGCAELQRRSFEPLPATEREAKDVAELWGTTAAQGAAVTRLLGFEATEGAIKELAGGRRVVHLATHGFFLGDECRPAWDSTLGGGRGAGADSDRRPEVGENPLLLSGLALSGANHRDAAGPEEDDGILTALEVSALDLSGTEWAVLSGCDTGLGGLAAGEGVLGLRRAFQAAGARTVIMSLWPVEDESARAWMRALYTARLKEKKSTAEAVREASLAVLRQRRAAKQSPAPLFWAGFVAAGDWR